MECLRLRVKDFDFAYSSIHIHDGKGTKDRIVVLPQSLHKPLADHLHQVKLIHEADLAKGLGEVYLPNALKRKYRNAAREWKWPCAVPWKTSTLEFCWPSLVGRVKTNRRSKIRLCCVIRMSIGLSSMQL